MLLSSLHVKYFEWFQSQQYSEGISMNKKECVRSSLSIRIFFSNAFQSSFISCLWLVFSSHVGRPYGYYSRFFFFQELFNIRSVEDVSSESQIHFSSTRKKDVLKWMSSLSKKFEQTWYAIENHTQYAYIHMWMMMINVGFCRGDSFVQWRPAHLIESTSPLYRIKNLFSQVF